MPFEFKQIRFSVTLRLSMTINRLQGNVLTSPDSNNYQLFNGQHYVGCCQIWSPNIFFILASNTFYFRRILIVNSILLSRFIPVGLGCKIRQPHLYRGVRRLLPTILRDMTLRNLMSRLKSRIFEEYGVPTLLQLFPDPLWSGMVAPDRVLSMGQIELFGFKTESKQMTCSIE